MFMKTTYKCLYHRRLIKMFIQTESFPFNSIVSNLDFVYIKFGLHNC